MKIARVETFLVPPRWLFCRIETDDGIVGWGEPVVEGRAEMVRGRGRGLPEYLMGADPLRITDTWLCSAAAASTAMARCCPAPSPASTRRCGTSRASAAACPVHALLGGAVRDRVRVYAWIGGDEPADTGRQIAAQVEAGFTAVKMNASGRAVARRSPAEVEAVAAARGDGPRRASARTRDMAMDFHGRVHAVPPRADPAELAPLRPLFVEEPVLPEHGHVLPAVVARARCRWRSASASSAARASFRCLRPGVAVVQPDLSHAGGITEVVRIASLADTFGAHLAPHCPLGPVALAASLQVGFAISQPLIQEQSLGIHYNDAGLLLRGRPGAFRFHRWPRRLPAARASA